MEIDHIRSQDKKMLPISQGGHLAKLCKSGSDSAIVHVRKPETGEVHCWRCGEVGHLKRNCPKNSRYQYEQHTRDKTGHQGHQKQNQGN